MINSMSGDGTLDDPYDLGRSGYSLINNRELLVACLDACAATSVVEVGSERGLLTAELLDWAGETARVTSIEPSPTPELSALAEEHPSLTLVRSPSLEAIPSLARFDAYILDGDHNYYTVAAELDAIDARAGSEFPLVLAHDVCWPHGRRDTYYAPDLIPPGQRQPIEADAWVSPWDEGTSDGVGLEYPAVAAREGGPANGVLTAIEDFIASRDGLRFACVPAFFGLGVIWPEEVPWADDLAAVVGPLADHPVLKRLEANRVVHLLERQRLIRTTSGAAAGPAPEDDRTAELEDELRRLLGSRAFAIAARLSAMRGSDAVSPARLRSLLDRS